MKTLLIALVFLSSPALSETQKCLDNPFNTCRGNGDTFSFDKNGYNVVVNGKTVHVDGNTRGAHVLPHGSQGASAYSGKK